MNLGSESQLSNDTAPVVTQGASHVTTSVNHPKLLRTDAEAIRIFLRLYDQYCNEITARSQQLLATGAVTTEAIRPVNLKYCVDPEYLESALALGFIEGVDDYDALTDTVLRNYLDSKAEESKECLNLEQLDSAVRSELLMNMKDKNSKSRMESLFMSYHSLLRRNGIAWILKDNQKIAVAHVLSAVKPKAVHDRLESDLNFAKVECREDFKKFMKHAIRVAEAFQLVDLGPKSVSNKGDSKKDKHNRGGNNFSRGSSERGSSSSGSLSARSKLTPPPCPFGPCKSKGLKHWIRDCKSSTDAEKTVMLNQIAAQKARDGPSKSTRSQVSASRADSSVSEIRSGGTIRRLVQNKQPKRYGTDSPSCRATVSDGRSSVHATVRCDDGSDDSLVSPTLAEKAAVSGIGKISSIEPVRIRVALKAGEEAQSFSFSRTWVVPRTVLHLASGQLALANITFLVADDELACEELLIGLPILRHLQVDTRTLLEDNRAVLDGADCSNVGNPTTEIRKGIVSRMMIARLNRIQEPNRSTKEKESPSETRPRVNFYRARSEEDPFPDPSLLDPIDEDQHGEIHAATEELKKAATDNGISANEAADLSKLVDDHKDIFRTGFSSGPPALIRPLRIELTPGARPVTVRLRNYSQEQKEFLSDTVEKLVRHGMAYPNPTSPWACAPLLVPKPGPARFRFTVDLRPVNKFTVKHQYPMPNLEHELTKLSRSRYFATFDLSHGYWQFELEKSSQALQSFITPDGIYSPTRVLHGTTNAVTHLQSCLAEILPNALKAHLLSWLDDILLHHDTVPGLLSAIAELFKLCVERNLKLHPGKCILFARTIRWCGRLISADGIRYDPKRLDGLLNMEPPTTGSHLQQFLCALQWVRNGIPNFTERIAPLHAFMERVYDRAGKRTKRAVARYNLVKMGWGETEADAFEACKQSLAHQVTLSHRDDAKRLCVYTDASDTVWSGIMTQVSHEDLTKPHSDQRHEPLAFLSGRFNATQLGWSVLEKEAYAILATLERMHWLAATANGFDLYTDHNNLIFLFDPLSVVPDLSQTTLRKVLRWAVRLSIYNYTCFHIKGANNVWADLLGRWSAPPTVRRLVHIPELPSSSATDFEWPTASVISDSQARSESDMPPNLNKIDGLWQNPNGAIWIPDSDSDLQLRLCIIAHTGPGGHRGQVSTESALRSRFFWSTMTSDVRSFVRACIHCLSTVGGGKVPRPFGPAVHGTKPNDLLQFDYIELGPSTDGAKYVLMLKDDHSGYCWFFPHGTTAAVNAADAIIDWCAAFGIPNNLMSDGPTHFKNETVRKIAKGLKVPHHFTLPYTPWSNGSIERLGKELLRVFRSVLSELQMKFEEWPDLLPMVQSAINNAPSPQRGNIAPVTAFMGIEPSNPVSTFLRTSTSSPITVSNLHRERSLNIATLRERMDALHPAVNQTASDNRKASRDAASRGELPNFAEGDYVLVAREDFFAGEKLALRWRGPRRVTKALNDYVFQVEDLRNGQIEEVHGTRLKFYRDGSLDKQTIMSHVLASETGMPVARLMQLVDEGRDGIKVLVRWKGLPHSEDSLEPLSRVFEDVPEMLKRLFLRKNVPPAMVQKARHLLSL